MSATLKFGTDGQWAVKDGYALAYNDENGNFKPLPFDFTRATSATRVNKDGLIETVGSNEPRIDFLNDSNGALKLEPQRTNLITYSEAFDNAYWTKSGVSVTSGFISPDGTANAFKLVEDTSTSAHFTFNQIVTTLGDTYSSKIYVKASESSKIGLREVSAINSWATFDLSLGTVIDSFGSTPKIVPLADDWYEISYSQVAGATTYFGIYILQDSYVSGTPNVSYTGDGTSGVYIYGAQIEAGSYATSYIPTQGTTVTRVADGLNTKDISLFSSINFYLFIDMNYISNAPETIFQLDDGAYNYIYLYNFRLELQDTLVSTLSLGNNKILIRNDNNNLTAFVNGVQTTSVTRKTILLNNLKLRVNPNSSINFNQVQYGNDITDSEAIALTTI